MKVQQSDIQLSHQHQAESVSWTQLKLGETSLQLPAFSNLFAQEVATLLPTPPAASPQESEALTREKAKTKRFQSLWELLFGEGRTAKKCEPTPPSSPPPVAGTAGATAAPTLVQVSALEYTRQSETCSFSASGKVCLADGGTRQFAVDYQLSQQQETMRAVEATVALRDPLVLDFAAPTTRWDGKAVQFDLNSDGQLETMKLPNASSALLFVDRNHNGVADNGSELLGPTSGDGFAELAQLDGDHNGWIDEGDAAFKDLKLWQSGVATAKDLLAAGVGALSVASAPTEFSLRDHNDVVAQIRASGVWLGEQGGAGVVRQVDVATKAI